MQKPIVLLFTGLLVSSFLFGQATLTGVVRPPGFEESSGIQINQDTVLSLLPKKLIREAETGQPVHIIVGLRAPFEPEGNLGVEKRIQDQRQAIADAQEKLLNELAGYNIDSIKRFKYIPYMAFVADAAALRNLLTSGEVMSIEEDIAVPAALMESVPLIGAPTAWSKGFSGSGQTVAILDTGVDKFHPFLAGKVVSEACYSTNDSVHLGSSLCPGGITASTAIGSGIYCSLQIEGCDHGTHVAGIAAGKGELFSGVAKDATIIAIQVFSRFDDATVCGGSRSTPCSRSYTSDQILGLQRVYELASTYHIAAVNMSIGSGKYTTNCDVQELSRKLAIDNLRARGIATIIASGNDSYIDGISAPACISSAISVGSTEDGGPGAGQSDTVSYFSNSGRILSLLAPGNSIYSSFPGARFGNDAGTSMATPHVAGAWAVLKSKSPTASVDQILSALISTGKAISDSRNGIIKSRIQVDAAINALSGPDTTPPSIAITSPTTGSTYLTSSTPITLSGTATDNVGVTQVTWSNSRGGSGVAFGTTGWTASGITLQSGTNVLIVTARDAAGNSQNDSLTITYTPPGCTYAISPTSRTHSANSESASVNLSAGTGCSWSAFTTATWITITSGASGSGNGTVFYSVPANNNTSSRTGSLIIGGQTYAVSQQGVISSPPVLISDVPMSGSLAANSSTTICTLSPTQYSILVPSNAVQLIVSLTGSADADLFVRYGSPVAQSSSTTTSDFRSESSLPNEMIYVSPQSTPSLLSGTYYIGIANCPNTLTSFSVKATVVTSSSPTKTEELGIDDGTFEGGVNGDGLILVNRLTPTRYPSKLKSIRVFIWNFQNQPDPVNKQVRLIGFTDPIGTGRPPNSPLLLVDQRATIPGEFGYITFDVPNAPTINSGDWYIGLQHPTPQNGVVAATDSTGNQRQRGFYSQDNGVTFLGPLTLQPSTPVNLMIRAVVENGISASQDTPVIDSGSASFLLDGTIAISIAGRDAGANATTVVETRYDSNGQILGTGTFDFSTQLSGQTSLNFGFNLIGGNRLTDTRQIRLQLKDANNYVSNLVTATLAGGGRTLSIPNRGVNAISTSGSGSAQRAGYAVAEVTSGSAPYGTAVFSLTQGGVIVSEAGVPSSPPTTRGRIFIDFRTNVPAKDAQNSLGNITVNTGFAVVNRGTGTAGVTYTLRDYTGTTITSGSGSLPANAHRALFIDQLSQIAPGFNLPGNFSTAIQFGTLEISSNQPLSLLGLRLTSNQRGDTLITSTPVADLARQPSGKLYFPQLADGGGFKSTVILVNTSSQSETGTIRIFANNGSPLPIRQIGDSSGAYSGFIYQIAAGGFTALFTDGSPSQVSAGSVQITPDAGTSTPVGAAILSFAPGGILVTETGVPSASPTNHARIYVDTSNGHNTGLAIAAPDNTPVSLTMSAYQNDGTTFVGSGSFSLVGNGHEAKFANEFISGLPPNFAGVLDISGSAPFVALTLRSLSNSRGDFLITTFPIADVNQSAIAPLVFPQIADGGGYQTQSIFVNASATGTSSNISINYYGDDGSTMALKSAHRESDNNSATIVKVSENDKGGT
ncbi:MAG: S8 family serine peptidase [Acidobacteriia bacterium]|nr:S8 family serine peptidase [Terriglobia bacterium]